MSVAERAKAILTPLELGESEPGGGRDRHWLLAEIGVAGGAIVVTLAIAGIVLRAWSWHLGLPSAYGTDPTFNAMAVKNILQHGWYFTNPSLAAPHGQQLYDFPLEGGNLPVLLIKVLGLFSSNAFVVMNLFFITTFVLVTMSAYLVLRCLRVSRVVSAGLSVLYSLLPYHFIRGESHLFLSGYFAVPLAVLLVVWAIGDPPLVRFNESSQLRGVRPQFDRRRLAAAIACCVVLGSTDVYYAVFGIVTLLGCGVIVAIGRWELRRLVICAALSATILVFLVVNLAPTLIYQHLHGVDTALQRAPLESELYGLKIARLFLPVAGHRFAPFADFTAKYGLFPIQGEESEALGAIFGIGLIVLFARGLAGRFQASSERQWRDRTLNTLALAAVVAILVGAMTGVSAIIALAITPQIRGWSRISVLIAFCAAAGLGLLLDQLFGQLRSTRWRWGVPSLVMVILVLVGSLDQTTNGDIPDFRTVSAQVSTTRSFVQTVQGRLPHGAMIFELPYEEFPEAGAINNMLDYSEVQGYLYSDTLRWSYGAMKGRPEDFSAPLSQYAPAAVARAVTVAGFSAIYVNRAGYSDNGADVDQALRAVVGPPVVTSTDGSLELYDLRPLAAQLRDQFPPAQLESLSHAVLHPVTVTYGSTFSPQESNPNAGDRLASNGAQLYLYNPDKSARTLRFDGSVATPASASSTVTISGPGVNASMRATSTGAPLSIDLRVPPGRSVVTLTTDAPAVPGDARGIHLRLVSPRFTDPDLAPLQG